MGNNVSAKQRSSRQPRASIFGIGITGSLCGLLVLLGCNDHPLKDVEYDHSIVDGTILDIEPYRDVDILFVIDNSGSMGEEQATLAANFEAFIDVLERDIDANYRIGVTTTDMGHPRCGGTGPEAGALVMSSCRSRLQQFVWDPGDGEVVDRRAEACESLCPAELADLRTTPSVTQRDEQERPRPWLERLDGLSNLPEGVDTAQAFACLGPQGIDGCGYEAPLESMIKAIQRSQVDDENQAGFLREEALLGIVFVTDEVDCSMQGAGAEAFDPSGARALWSDPQLAYPTSAVCWNAGVSCQSDPDGTTQCVSANIGVDGNPTTPDQAVLHPLSRYVDFLEDLRARKQDAREQSNVRVAVLTGVPAGFPNEAISYGFGVDAQFETDYGVAPGCSSEHGEAVPPVRLKEVAEAFPGLEGDPLLFSICEENYRPALEAIAADFARSLGPACASICPGDADPSLPGLQPTCVVYEVDPDGRTESVPWCEIAEDGTESLPEGADVCVALRVGADSHPDCHEDGMGAEFVVKRRPGAPRVGGTRLQSECSVADRPERVCGV